MSERILLVDDDDLIRTVVTERLRRRGYEVSAAGCLADARAALKGWQPDAALLDIRLPDGNLWAAGRRYGEKPTTVLARMTRDSYEPVLTLPSGGDCSYPGMVWHDGFLWMSYYSSHEGKTGIYLAKVKMR